MRGALTGALLGLSLTAIACVPHDLAFRQDTRLSFVSPDDGAEVTLPVVLEWTMQDFDLRSAAHPEGGSFAVFLDQPPVPPGKTLDWVARDDTYCQERRGCPSARYLADKGIFETTRTKLRLKELPDVGDSATGANRHYATIILLDSEGARIGEIAYGIAFELPEETQS